MSIVKDTIAITAITLVAGLALGVVQDITADPIAQQQASSPNRKRHTRLYLKMQPASRVYDR